MTAGPTEMSGIRASSIVFIGVGVANLANYVFHLVSARYLGPALYGDVAALAGLSGIIALPLSGAQIFVARHVAGAWGQGRALNDDGYVSGVGGAMLLVGGVTMLALLALSPLIQSALSIGSLWAVVFTVLYAMPAYLAPVLLGAAQGLQRFMLVAAVIGIPPLLRIVFSVAALEGGLGVPGAVGGSLAASLVAVGFPLAVLWPSFKPLRAWRPRLARREVIALLPIVAGMLAMAALTTDDLVVAKAVFNAHQAGLYGSASLIGRVILYLPAAVITVLLPKVSARVSARLGSTDLFVRSLVATAGFCLAATLVYAIVPHLIVRIAFSSKYEGSASLLWLFGVAMSLYALLNLLLVYRLGHGETRTCWLLLAGAIVQGGIFAVFHSTPRELLVASIAIGAGLLVAAVVGPLGQSRSRGVGALRGWDHGV